MGKHSSRLLSKLLRSSQTKPPMPPKTGLWVKRDTSDGQSQEPGWQLQGGDL